MPTPKQATADSRVQGLKLADLQASGRQDTEPRAVFSILSYVLDVNSLELLRGVKGLLSQQDIHYDNAEAFGANGFFVGVASHQQGALVAQKLQSIGAVRLSRTNLVIALGTDEIFYRFNTAEPKMVRYWTSATAHTEVTMPKGQFGWVVSTRNDTTMRGLIHVAFSPAFWRVGASNLRLLEGKEPYEFNFFDAIRVHMQMEVGQICLLAPDRVLPDQDTLDGLLSVTPQRDKVRFFVIICEAVED